MQENQIGGSAQLKTEIRRLASGISFASSEADMIATNPKIYKKEEMELVLKGLETNLNAFLRAYSNLVKKNREKQK